jgi:flagellar biosynthesis protein
MDEQKKLKLATALQYNQLKNRAPKVIAKGQGLIAENIIEKAQDHDVPIYQDERLSQQLYNLALGDEIPAELYHVVAEVLVFIAKADQEAGKR